MAASPPFPLPSSLLQLFSFLNLYQHSSVAKQNKSTGFICNGAGTGDGAGDGAGVVDSGRGGGGVAVVEALIAWH